MQDNSKLASVQVNLHEVRHLLRHDPEFFIEFFLGDIITQSVPDLHKEALSILTAENISRVVLALPRGHGKTTLAKLCAVWHLVFSQYRFILYISASKDLVVPYVNDIADFFDIDNFISVFGPVEWLIRQDGVGKYKFYIPSIDKTCILVGLGMGQRVRGINIDNERPQLVICDDFEDDTLIETPIPFDKALNWWTGPFYKCLNQFNNKIIVIGNHTKQKSLLKQFIESPHWHSRVYGVIRQNGQPLWPELWSLEKIKADYEEYQYHKKTERWFAEMMNVPVPEGGSIISINEIKYCPPRQPGDGLYGCITCDPAISRNAWADRAAIAAHIYVDNDIDNPHEGIWQTVEVRYWRGIDPTDLFWQIIDLATTWRIRHIGVEAVAMQSALEYLFRHLAYTNGLTQYSFVPLPTHNQAKAARIIAWASQLKHTETKSATWALTSGDFIITKQLLSFAPTRRDNDDDIIDCCAYGPRMVDQYIDKIILSDPLAPKSSYTPLHAYATL